MLFKIVAEMEQAGVVYIEDCVTTEMMLKQKTRGIWTGKALEYGQFY